MTELTGPADSSAARTQLERLLASERFARSKDLSRFLRYMVEETLAGRSAELKELSVGMGVFQRGENFDPRIDPIVRVQARNLRAKLEQYYRHEGAEDPIIIDLEKGSYIPAFRTRQAEQPPAEELTIAVLPFTNSSPEPEMEYFSDGITEEVMRSVARVPGALVAARTSVFAFKGVQGDVREVGARLGVAYVIEGSVRRSGDRVRVSASLVEAATGFQRWSEVYELGIEEAAAIEQKIGEEIAAALHTGMPAEAAAHTHGIEVYETYWKARYHWAKRTDKDVRASIACYERAMAQDKTFAPAYSGLADCYTLLAIYGYLPATMIVPKAKQLAARALELDPASAQAHTTIGMISATYDYDFPRAESSFLLAIESDPNYPDAHQWYANFYLSPLGRFDEAVDELEIALRLDPLSVYLLGDLGNTLSIGGKHPEGLEVCEQAIARAPGFFRPYWQAGLALERMERYSEAIERFLRCRELSKGDVFESSAVGALGHCYGAAGRKEEALACLAELESRPGGRPVNPLSFAIVYLGMGDHDKTFEWLDRAVTARVGPVIWTAMDHRGKPLHGDPRFQKLLDRLNLSSFYRKV